MVGLGARLGIRTATTAAAAWLRAGRPGPSSPSRPGSRPKIWAPGGEDGPDEKWDRYGAEQEEGASKCAGVSASANPARAGRDCPGSSVVGWRVMCCALAFPIAGSVRYQLPPAALRRPQSVCPRWCRRTSPKPGRWPAGFRRQACPRARPPRRAQALRLC